MALKHSEENENTEKNSNEELLKIIKKQAEDTQKLQEQLKEIQASRATLSSADVLAQALQSMASKQEKKELDYEAGIPEEDIPEDDFLEEGVRFCAPFVGYVISDDKRKGQRVVLPYGKKVIEFDYAATKVTQTGKHQNTHPISAYISRSKKEVEWLRKHSLYGTMFFETSTAAANADAVKATKLASIMTYLKDYEFHDLMARAKENGVPMNDDINVLKTNLAFKILENELKAQEEQVRRTLEDNYKAQTLALK